MLLLYIVLYFSTEDVEELLEETREAIEKQKEIDELLSGKLTQVRGIHWAIITIIIRI